MKIIHELESPIYKKVTIRIFPYGDSVYVIKKTFPSQPLRWQRVTITIERHELGTDDVPLMLESLALATKEAKAMEAQWPANELVQI